MVRNRADEILEGWKMTVEEQARPVDPPRPKRAGNALPLAVVATLVLILIVAIPLALRGLPGGVGGGPGGSSRASGPACDAVVVPDASAGCSFGSSPTVSFGASVRASAAASGATAEKPTLVQARTAVDQYTQYLIQGQYAKAWAMLMPTVQQGWGTLANFEYERKPYFASVGGVYSISFLTGNDPLVTQGPANLGVPIDQALVLMVDYPKIPGPHNYDIFYVALVEGQVMIAGDA